MSAASRTERVEIRIPEVTREIWEEAARAKGMTMTEFIEMATNLVAGSNALLDPLTSEAKGIRARKGAPGKNPGETPSKASKEHGPSESKGNTQGAKSKSSQVDSVAKSPQVEKPQVEDKAKAKSSREVSRRLSRSSRARESVQGAKCRHGNAMFCARCERQEP